MDEEWFTANLQLLHVKETRLSTLQVILEKISGKTLSANIVEQLLRAPELYDFYITMDLNGVNYDIQTTTLDILWQCMKNINYGVENPEMAQLLYRSLKHPQTRVRALGLNIIRDKMQCYEDDEPVNKVITTELMPHILDALQDPDEECGRPAAQISKCVFGPRLKRDSLVEQLQGMLDKDLLIRCRVYDVVVSLAMRSASNLKALLPVLEDATREFDVEDTELLDAEKVLSILLPLTHTEHGRAFMDNRLVFGAIISYIKELAQTPDKNQLVPDIMKFVGILGATQPDKIISGYPHLVKSLFKIIRNAETGMLPQAFETLGKLGSTQHGKHLLELNFPRKIELYFKLFRKYLQSLQNELKIDLFHMLEVLFTVMDEPAERHTNYILKKWFDHLCECENMSYLFELMNTPVTDVKVACIELVTALCRYHWGNVALLDTDGFMDYLLNRNSEIEESILRAKFELISVMAKSDVYSIENRSELQKYVNEGSGLKYDTQNDTERESASKIVRESAKRESSESAVKKISVRASEDARKKSSENASNRSSANAQNMTAESTQNRTSGNVENRNSTNSQTRTSENSQNRSGANVPKRMSDNT